MIKHLRLNLLGFHNSEDLMVLDKLLSHLKQIQMLLQVLEFRILPEHYFLILSSNYLRLIIKRLRDR